MIVRHVVEALDERLQPLARVDAVFVAGLVAGLAGGHQVAGGDLGAALARGSHLRAALDAGGFDGLGVEVGDVAGLVVQDLELEARGTRDDLADGVEVLFGGARHLDDQVTLGLATDHRRLPQAHGVDAVADGALGLLDRLLAHVLQSILTHGQVELEPLGAGAAQVGEVVAEPLVVEEVPVLLVLELDPDAAAADPLHRDALLHLGDLLAGGGVDIVVVEDADEHADLAHHLLGVAVTPIADVLVDLDLVAQAQAALDVEAGVDAAGEDVANPLRRGHCDLFSLFGEAVEAGPEREPCGRDGENDDRETEIPGTIHRWVA